jgi:hypothetical protein
VASSQQGVNPDSAGNFKDAPPLAQEVAWMLEVDHETKEAGSRRVRISTTHSRPAERVWQELADDPVGSLREFHRWPDSRDWVCWRQIRENGKRRFALKKEARLFA